MIVGALLLLTFPAVPSSQKWELSPCDRLNGQGSRAVAVEPAALYQLFCFKETSSLFHGRGRTAPAWVRGDFRG